VDDKEEETDVIMTMSLVHAHTSSASFESGVLPGSPFFSFFTLSSSQGYGAQALTLNWNEVRLQSASLDCVLMTLLIQTFI
jgi:hypothetical protein